jgi:ABC-type bacteriocin/lantibiotic exporter with double-glycine peptidase domain
MKKMLNFPFSRQCYQYDCGANAMESILNYYGKDVNEGDIIKIAKTTSREGTNFDGLKRVADKFKLRYKQKIMTIEEIKKNINHGRPVLIDLQAWKGKEIRGKWVEDKNKDWENDWKDGHYVVAMGYSSNKIFFEDPSATARTFLSYRELKKRWHDTNVGKKKYYNWGMIFNGKPRYNKEKVIHMD